MSFVFNCDPPTEASESEEALPDHNHDDPFVNRASDATMVDRLRTVIFLSFMLAVGFLLIILSCALWSNWLPLLVALTFVLAPLPNALFAHCTPDDFISSSDYDTSSPAVDLGRFITSCIVVTGFGLPLILQHAEIIKPAASYMSIIGGACVYGTILAYTAVFKEESEEF